MIIAVLDADVLYPLPLRDTLLHAAAQHCYQPLWSERILEEMSRNLVADRRMTREGVDRMITAMTARFGDALVSGHDHLIGLMTNHPKDRHVAACAFHNKAHMIVTGNIRDFRDLPAGIEALTPDAFLCRLLDRSRSGVREALLAQSARLRRPPLSVSILLDLLRVSAPDFAAAFRAANPDLC